MGWTGMHRPKGIKDIDWLRGEMTDGRYEVLDTARVGFTIYAAVRNTETDEVNALVILVRHDRDPYYNFYYKDMDETMGPYEHKAPERILDLLTPTTNETALEWRAKARAYHEHRKARPKVTKGDTLVFTEPIAGHTRFVLVDARRNVLQVEQGYQRYRVPWWRKLPYTVEKKEAA